MRIIVEGPDGAGKTTLIQSLLDTEPTQPVRNKMEDKQDFDQWWPEILNWHGNVFVPLHDRFFYSELVYGPVIRGCIKAKMTTIVRVQKELRSGAALIYCRPSFAAIQAAASDKPQMAGVLDNLEILVKEYDTLLMQEATEYGRRFYLYDWQADEEPRGVTKFVRAYLSGGLQ